jgi:hypothetical protein
MTYNQILYDAFKLGWSQKTAIVQIGLFMNGIEDDTGQRPKLNEEAPNWVAEYFGIRGFAK